MELGEDGIVTPEQLERSKDPTITDVDTFALYSHGLLSLHPSADELLKNLAQNPGIDVDTLRGLLIHCPKEALQNPALPLYIFTHPNFFSAKDFKSGHITALARCEAFQDYIKHPTRTLQVQELDRVFLHEYPCKIAALEFPEDVMYYPDYDTAVVLLEKIGQTQRHSITLRDVNYPEAPFIGVYYHQP